MCWVAGLFLCELFYQRNVILRLRFFSYASNPFQICLQFTFGDYNCEYKNNWYDKSYFLFSDKSKYEFFNFFFVLVICTLKGMHVSVCVGGVGVFVCVHTCS